MNTEITQTTANLATRGQVFYDADCSLCRRFARRWSPVFGRRGYLFQPLQSASNLGPGAPAPAQFMEEMQLRRTDGRWLGGVAAWIELGRSVGWLQPLAWLAALPGFNAVAVALYRHLARHRRCLGGVCELAPGRPFDRWVPLLLLPAGALAAAPRLEPWQRMGLIALALYAGFKWLTFRDGPPVAGRHARAASYLLLWPGMDPDPFLGARTAQAGKGAPPHPAWREWAFVGGKMALGAALVWGLVPLLDAAPGWVTGGTGMLGLLLLMHFGLFHLLALVWRTRGLDVRPNMRAPLRASSLADLWGRRWNTAFNRLATTYAFQPLAPWLGTAGATLVVFLISGGLHELAITVPAGAGFGGPTVYFLLQALGLLAERHPWLRNRPVRRRLWAWVLAAAPVPFLFPPVFIERVILPLLGALGAR